ncbi:Antitoxin VapB [Tepidimonas sediminis]|uniref:Antitoxin VapB n=1 Tax=Tepidimonas sediminis TaxID=2588941 RepID=A0A554WVA4_9BURK|nr:type II toxin-antitoxin system VapB family antitoxin [Tepidimonas sediminis]TSE27509.1 Antitoxin VapB [Tepidimonas sediminis]
MTTAAVFSNNRSQAVRLPASMRLPDHVKRVEIRRRGAERILCPPGQRWDSFFLDPQAETVPEDFLPQRADQQQPGREAL